MPASDQTSYAAASAPAWWITFKHLVYCVAFMQGLAYLNITPISVVVLTSFVFIDLATGVLRTIFLHGGSAFKSSVLERGLVAKCLIILLPVAIAFAGKGIGADLSGFAQAVINAMIFGELYSFIGNINSIRTGKDTHEFDAITYILDQIKSVLKRFITDDHIEK